MFRYTLLAVTVTVLLAGCTTSTDVEELTYTACEDGSADGYPCNNIDLYAHMTISELLPDSSNSASIRLNDIWGWVDPQTAQEYAIIGLTNGVSFVDVSNPSEPVYIGTLPLSSTGRVSSWRDAKVYENHVYIVADNSRDHGMQVFDLTNLREFNGTPLIFDESAFYDRISSAHNIVINEESGFAYIVGSNGGGETCGGGLHMVNLADPQNPQFAGCFSDPSTGRVGTGYTHDAQCVNYNGPDADYAGNEICFGSNETAVSIADVTDKSNPQAISTASYPMYAYVHQGWLSEDHRYFFLNDEWDESRDGMNTQTYIWDLEDLDNPEMLGMYEHDTFTIDHNLYTKGSLMYQANYTSGLRILDIENPEPDAITTLAYFDTTPDNNRVEFSGLWSVYPYLSGDKIIVSDMNNGLFILRHSR